MIQIHGKNYVQVNERIKEFRSKDEYKGWAILTEIVSIDENSCVMKTTIADEEGNIRATGYAQEDRTSSTINKTSYVENCETSAVGRALGMLGIGIDTSIASAEEMQIAVGKQEQIEAKEPIIGGDYIFQGGKFIGKPIKEAPKNYLDWCLGSDVSEQLKANIKRYYADNGIEVEI